MVRRCLQGWVGRDMKPKVRGLRAGRSREGFGDVGKGSDRRETC